MDICILEDICIDLKDQCKKYLHYLEEFDELPGRGSDFASLEKILIQIFIEQQIAEMFRFSKSGDMESASEVFRYALEGWEDLKAYK